MMSTNGDDRGRVLSAAARLLGFAALVGVSVAAFARGAELLGTFGSTRMRFQPWPGPGPEYGWMALLVGAIGASIVALVMFCRWAKSTRGNGAGRMVGWVVYLVGSAIALLFAALSAFDLLVGLSGGPATPEGSTPLPQLREELSQIAVVNGVDLGIAGLACPSDPWERCYGAYADFRLPDATTPASACATFYAQIDLLAAKPLAVLDDAVTVTDESASIGDLDAFVDLCVVRLDERNAFAVAASANTTVLTNATVEGTLRAPNPYKLDDPGIFNGTIRVFPV